MTPNNRLILNFKRLRCPIEYSLKGIENADIQWLLALTLLKHLAFYHVFFSD